MGLLSRRVLCALFILSLSAFQTNAQTRYGRREIGAQTRPEIIIQARADTGRDLIERLAQAGELVIRETQTLGLLNSVIYLAAASSASRVRRAIRELSSNPAIISVQVNSTFVLQQQPSEGDPAQYALPKMHLPKAHLTATGEGVRIGVIDTAVDVRHPEFAGSIVSSYDLFPNEDTSGLHGTGVVGGISAHGRLMGAAPSALIFNVVAFGEKHSIGTTYRIVRGLDWAAAQGVRVINMSFGGPRDPLMQVVLKAAQDKGIVLVAAVGNNGPSGPPLYPGAYPSVIAVTATDSNDRLFPAATRGSHISIAAPGADIFLPAPEGKYQLTSGTSFSAAYVTGIVALMIEANPMLTPELVRKILAETAKNLGSSEKFGAGLVDAARAIEAARNYKPN